MSAVFNQKGTVLCVLNGGKINGVNCYKTSETHGLTAIPNSNRSLGVNQTTPATGPAGSVSQLIFSQDERQLIVSVKGTPPTPGFFALWNISADGSLSQDFTKLAPPTGGVLPFSMTPIPGQNAAVVTDPGLGFDIVEFSAGATRSSAVNITGQSAVCWGSFSQKTGNYYLTDVGTATVTEINVDKDLKGSIVKVRKRWVSCDRLLIYFHFEAIPSA